MAVSNATRLMGIACAGMLCVLLVACGTGESRDGSGHADTDGPGNYVKNPDAIIAPGSAALSPDGKRIVAKGDNLCIWDTGDGTIIDRFDGSKQQAWSPDGSIIATSQIDGDEADVLLIDAHTGQRRQKMSGHTVPQTTDSALGVRGLVFSADGDMLASVGDDDTVRLWSVPSGKAHAVLEVNDAVNAAFSADGSRLAVATAADDFSEGAPVQMWDVQSGERLDVPESLPLGDQVAFSPDGDVLAIADNAREKLYAVGADTRGAATPYPSDVKINDVVFSPDGSRLVFSDRDSQDVIVWSIEDQEKLVLSGHKDTPDAVRVSPDGRFIYSLSQEEGIFRWRADDGKLLDKFERP